MESEETRSQDAPPQREPDEIIDRRYRLIRTLGRGGMGSVYLVEDELHPGLRLALKQVRRDRSDPKSVAILKNEFLALRQLHHPNLARAYHFGYDRQTEDYYFTAEYVRGIQLYKATQGFDLASEGDLKMLLYLFVEILRVLELMHSRGLVHGDLKPENLLVSSGKQGAGKGDSSSVRVKLIDFGLTKREKDFGGKKIFGTSFYIAPETILGSQVDRRTDLYSLGVVLYHMAVRKLPFSGKSNYLVLKGHLEDAPPRPSEANSKVPDELSEIILRMIAKKPGDRYPSAVSVIEDINTRLGLRFPVETPETTNSYLHSPECIGRARELGELCSFFQSNYQQSESEAADDLQLSFGSGNVQELSEETPAPPSGRFFLIRGEERIGKSRLLSDFKDFVEVRGVQFVDVALEAPAEIGDKSNLLRLFTRLSRCFVPEENNLQSYIVKLLGTLPNSIGDADPEQEIKALEVLVDALLPTCKTVPLVLVFRHLHHAGESFLRFLRVLVEKIAASEDKRMQIMVIGTVLEEEIESVVLRRLLLSPEIRSHFREIPLERLTRDELESLLEGMFGAHRFPSELVGRIYEESDGSPGFVHDILKYFVRKSRLQHTAAGWRYFGDVVKDTVPGHVRSQLKKRIQNLGPEELRLGLAFAFLGNACELDVAVQLADIEPAKILPTLMALKKQRLLREVGEGKADHYAFTQRSTRDLFRQLPSPADQVKIHRRAGAILDERYKAGLEADVGGLAYHYLRGGNQELGMKYSLRAAEAYAREQLPHKALDVYWDMRKRCDASAIPSVGDVDFRIAVLEAETGNPRAAVGILRQLLDAFASGSFDGVTAEGDVHIELGKIYYRLGEFRRSGKHFQSAYHVLKSGGMSPSFLKLLMGYGRLFQIRGNYLESFRYCDKTLANARILDHLTQAKLHLLTSENHFMLNDVKRAIASCNEGMALLDGYKDIGYMGFTFFFLGKFYIYKGKLENAIKQFRTAAKTYRRVGLVDWEARAFQELGKVLLLVGRTLAARQVLLRSYQLDERIENFSGLVETLELLGETHRVLGRYEEAEGFLRQALSFINRFGMSRKLRGINTICSRICLDRGNLVQSAEFLNQRENDRKKNDYEDEVSVLSKLELQTRIALMQGDYRLAADLMARGSIRSREVKNRMTTIPNLELRGRLYTALGKHAEAQRALSQMLEIGKQHHLPIVVAKAAMLGGTAQSALGEHVAALKTYDRALQVFKENEAERELAELYLELSRTQLALENYEKASIYVEEGFYLAKKLNLVFHRTRYLHVMGELESVSPEGDEGRSNNYFQSAFKLAAKHGFLGLLWQIRFAQGRLFFDHEVYTDAAAILGEAYRLYQTNAERIPDAFQESYTKATGAGVLETLVVEARDRVHADEHGERAAADRAAPSSEEPPEHEAAGPEAAPTDTPDEAIDDEAIAEHETEEETEAETVEETVE